MDFRFDGKRALVTGAGKGFGRCIAKALVNSGAETYAVSRTQSDLDSLVGEVPGIHTVTLDLSDWEVTREVISDLGHFDLLVNNAGIGCMTPFLETSEAEIDRIFAVNYKAMVNVAQVVCRGMKERDTGGAVVNMSSVSSTTPCPGLGVYCCSKASVDMLTKIMAVELGPHKIRVNSVNPCICFDTNMGNYLWTDPDKPKAILSQMPLGRFAELEGVKNATLFFLSDKSGNSHGQHLRLDSGYF